ncbi:hypothetical protein GCM10010376_57790 [Streptomyces violaceusniger]
MSPDTTTAEDPFTAATDSRSHHGDSRSRTSATGRLMDTMPPRPDSARNARLRSATTRAASFNDNPPATHAAAISPWE